MGNNRETRGDSNIVVRQKKPIIKKVLIALLIFAVIIGSLALGLTHFYGYFQRAPSLSKVYDAWDSRNYPLVYQLSNEVTARHPYEGTALAYHGYASFFLGISATDTTEIQKYLDESINSLRIAQYYAPEKLLPQIYYMLGKAYFQKDKASSYHYYADLTVYYLHKATESGFTANDIPSLLGLSYSQLNMTEESIAAFSDALGQGETDTLLLAIAEQYINNGQQDSALPYLYRLRTFSDDAQFQIKAGLLLAEIYVEEGKYDEALTEYNTILEKNPENADAYYGIGIIYEKQGDIAKARAEWRTALKKQPNHTGARQKLG